MPLVYNQLCSKITYEIISIANEQKIDPWKFANSENIK